MNDSERTPSKKAKLKLKSFFKRNLVIKKIISLLDCKTDHRITIQGSGSAGGKGDITANRMYVLEAIKSTHYIGHVREKRQITRWFNKPQLKGKLILIKCEYYRIIN